MNRGVAVADRAQVALEVTHVDGVEADLSYSQLNISESENMDEVEGTHNSDEETDVGFC